MPSTREPRSANDPAGYLTNICGWKVLNLGIITVKVDREQRVGELLVRVLQHTSGEDGLHLGLRGNEVKLGLSNETS